MCNEYQERKIFTVTKSPLPQPQPYFSAVRWLALIVDLWEQRVIPNTQLGGRGMTSFSECIQERHYMARGGQGRRQLPLPPKMFFWSRIDNLIKVSWQNKESSFFVFDWRLKLKYKVVKIQPINWVNSQQDWLMSHTNSTQLLLKACINTSRLVAARTLQRLLGLFFPFRILLIAQQIHTFLDKSHSSNRVKRLNQSFSSERISTSTNEL